MRHLQLVVSAVFLLTVVLALPGNGQCVEVKGYQRISDTEGDFSGDLDDVDLFHHVAVTGDVDLDGVNDFAVGDAQSAQNVMRQIPKARRLSESWAVIV